MRINYQRVHMTADAVYQPLKLLVEMAFVPVGTVFLVVVLLTTQSRIWIFLALAVPATLIHALWAFKSHGWLGKPVVAVAEGILHFSQPGSTDPPLRIPLDELSEVIVYGRRGLRTFRFLRKDGTYFEARPLFGGYLEMRIEEFMHQQLPPKPKVTIKEPQTFFASVRGDDP